MSTMLALTNNDDHYSLAKFHILFLRAMEKLLFIFSFPYSGLQ